MHTRIVKWLDMDESNNTQMTTALERQVWSNAFLQIGESKCNLACKTDEDTTVVANQVLTYYKLVIIVISQTIKYRVLLDY